MFLQRRLCLEWILGIALLGAPLTFAQQGRLERRDEDQQARRQAESEPIFVFRISPKLLANGLDLLVEKRLAKDYGLDDYQREEMRQLLHEHVPKFLRKHQSELQDLWAEWMEAQAAREPPDPEDAARWAERLLPIVKGLEGMIDDVSGGMREFLDDEQQVMLDGYLAAINIGTKTMSNRLRVFEDGGFDPEIHWPGYKQVRHMEIEQTRQLQQKIEKSRQLAMQQSRGERRLGVPEPVQSDEATLVAQVTPETSASKAKQTNDEWARYVEWFIRRYRLNDEQKQKAEQFLKQQNERRDKHLLARVEEMERVAAMFDNAQTDKERALAESSFQRLNQPLERMFDELKRKLDTLPTRAQRRAAAEADRKARERSRSAPTHAAESRQP